LLCGACANEALEEINATDNASQMTEAMARSVLGTHCM
jgi:hypothetical protein